MVKSFAFKCAMWVLVGVGTLLVALGVGLAFLVCVPVVVGYSLWEFFIGRHKPKTLEQELAELVKAHNA